MHPPRLTIGRLMLVVAASGVGFASLQGNHVGFMGLSIMAVLGLLGAAIGAGTADGRSMPTSPQP